MAETEFDYFTRAELCDKLKFTEERLDNLSIKKEHRTAESEFFVKYSSIL